MSLTDDDSDDNTFAMSSSFVTQSKYERKLLHLKELKLKLENELLLSLSHLKNLEEKEKTILKKLELEKYENDNILCNNLQPSLEKVSLEILQENDLKESIENELQKIIYELTLLQTGTRSFIDLNSRSVSARTNEKTLRQEKSMKRKLLFSKDKYNTKSGISLSTNSHIQKNIRSQSLEQLTKQNMSTYSCRHKKFDDNDISERDNEIKRRYIAANMLKISIERSKDVIEAQRAKQLADKRLMKDEEKQVVDQALFEDKDPKTELALNRRLAEIEARHKVFKETQRRRHKEIVAKLMREELLQNEKVKRLSFLFENKSQSRKLKFNHPEIKLSHLEKQLIQKYVENGPEILKANKLKSTKQIQFKEQQLEDDIQYSENENEIRMKKLIPSFKDLDRFDEEYVNSVTEENVNELLHNFTYGTNNSNSITQQTNQTETILTKEPKNVESVNYPARNSKADKEMLQRVLQRTRENIIQPQYVAGRKFEGPSFTAKPEVIWFKDFDVNKQHTISVTLTNASYKISSCRFSAITSTLIDFVDIKFSPSGQLSPGMSCLLEVNFTPKLNIDLKGQLEFLSPNGPFLIPFKATTKKCEFSVNSNHIDFGQITIGETVRRTIILKNSGAKGSNFQFIIAGSEKRNTNECVINENENQLNNPNIRQDEMGNEIKDHETSNLNMIEDIQENSKDITPNNEIETSTLENLIYTSNFSTGLLNQGFIEPFSIINLEIIWSPKLVPDSTLNDFSDKEQFIIQFDDQNSSPIPIDVIGYPKDLPIWLSRTTIIMGICWFDRLYQDCFTVNNRTCSAIKVSFSLDSEIMNHLEILPKTGFVQAKSRLLVQIKLLPRQSIIKDLESFLDQINEQDTLEDGITTYALSYCPHTGVIQIPVTVHVAGQTNTLKLMVSAVLTTSDLLFPSGPIDFGWAEAHETVVRRISLTNLSLLPQSFGIVDLPEYLDVQPNDGFGKILPKETIELELLFHPNKARQYKFDLVCKSGIGRKFTVACSGIGVQTPLCLSTHQIKFPATPVNEFNTTSLLIHNTHISSNPFTHSQPKIGSEQSVVKVGPTGFELKILSVSVSNSDGLISDSTEFSNESESILKNFISFYPNTGTLLPGKKQKVLIRFSPHLNKRSIQEEACRLIDLERQRTQVTISPNATELLEIKQNKKDKSNDTIKNKTTMNKKEKSIEKKSTKILEETISDTIAQQFIPTDPQTIVEDSIEYLNGLYSLIRNYPHSSENDSIELINQTDLDLLSSDKQNKHIINLNGYEWSSVCIIYRVACFVANGPALELSSEPTPTFRNENTLFLEMICPIIRPSLLITHLNTSGYLDFGAICAEQQTYSNLSIENISSHSLKVTCLPLNPVGPFELVNFIPILIPGQIFDLSLKFSPKSGQDLCRETLVLQSIPVQNESRKFCKLSRSAEPKFSQHITLQGICVTPTINLIGSYGFSTLQTAIKVNAENPIVQNVHQLNFGYILVGDIVERQLTLENPTKVPLNYELVVDESEQRGTQNRNGNPVFMVIPCQGNINPEEKKILNISFAPDHESEYYHETLLLKLYSQLNNSHKIRLYGASKSQHMYIRGADQINTNLDLKNDNLGLPFLTENKETGGIKHCLTICATTLDTSTITKDENDVNLINELVEFENIGKMKENLNSLIKETPNQQYLFVGIIQSSNYPNKKPGEFIVENINELTDLGFSVTPSKSTIESGTEQSILFTWMPNPDVMPGSIVKAVANIVLRSDIVTTNRIILRGVNKT